MLPAQMMYLTVYESMRQSCRDMTLPGALAKHQDIIVNFSAGGLASFLTQLVIVPSDVVSQRLMVQPSSSTHGVVAYRSGMDAVRRIFSEHGIRGLYRGLVVSMMTYPPANAIWCVAFSAPPPPPLRRAPVSPG